jgi:ABC-type amino acid transport system permease subunit
MRRAVRHPLEILALVVAIAGSVLVLWWAITEFVSAAMEERDPDVYAVILVAAPVLVWFLRG